MTEIQAVRPAFVAYRAGDLREYFKKAITHHSAQAEIHPMGPEGFHESLKKLAEASWEALDMQTKDDGAFLTFPTALSDFATAVNSSEQMGSFLEYHNQGRIGLLTPREASGLGLIRGFS